MPSAKRLGEKKKTNPTYLVVKKNGAPFEELTLIGPYSREDCLNISARIPLGYEIVITAAEVI